MISDYEILILTVEIGPMACYALYRVVTRGTTLGTARTILLGMVEVDHLTTAHTVGNHFVSADESIDQIQC